jgi:Ca2+-binding RTX toxin-like protein
MMGRKMVGLALSTLLLCIATAIGSSAAANQVPVTGMTDTRRPTTPNDLKPPECAALMITAIRDMSGKVVGSGANQLILGSAAGESISGGDGNDCIVGGPGGDWLFGGAGDDVLVGGPGFDWCFGQDGTNILDSCEIGFP